MEGCELVNIVSILSCIISKGKTTDELNLLAAIFSQLGDSLGVIASANDK